jgi:excisionase family DNA binding protein
MTDRVIIPLPGVGTLAMDREVFEQALAAGASISAAPAGSHAASDEPLMSSDQLAAALGVPVSWIDQKAREGVIPSLEFGRWRRFRRSEVEAAVSRREH